MAEENKSARPSSPKTEIKLRSRDELDKARRAEIIRAMRDAADAGQSADPEWVNELAGLVGVDIRKR